MIRVLVTIAIICLFQLSRVNSLKFSITRDITQTKALDQTNWCFVEIIENENFTVKIDIPLDIFYSGLEMKPNTILSDLCNPWSYEVKRPLLTKLFCVRHIFIYFANKEKEILKVNLNESVEGKFYQIPYMLVKEMKAGKTETVEKDNYRQVIGEFPKFWLPNNSSKISAAVECVDGRILNYYGIQNFEISFSDLMILEEYKNYKSY